MASFPATLRCCVLLCLLVSLSLLAVSGQGNDTVTAAINLANATSAIAVQPNFASFSIEVSSALGWTGLNTTRPKASFLTLMSYLRLTPHAPGPILRIGGNSADTSWWNPLHRPRPANVSYDIAEVDLLAVDAAVRAINGSAVYGLNFRRGGNSSWAVAHAAAIERLIGWDRARLEIGNECDLYGGNGIRNSTWSFAEYDTEWTAYAADIAKAIPRAPAAVFQGATFASNRWVPDIPAWAAAHVKQLSTVSVRSYPNTHCNNHTVTIDMLLTDAATQNEASYLRAQHVAADLARLGLPLQLGEGNDVSCGGMPGISNSFASALWAVDTMFNLADAGGVYGHNFHGGGSYLGSYSAFVFANDTTEVVTVQPLFYALHLFARATRDYPRIVSTNVQSSTNRAIKLHSTWNGRRATTTIVHKQYNRTVPATITLTYTQPAPATDPSQAFTFPTASLYRLYAASMDTEFDVSLSGASWRGSRDGRLVGEMAVEKVVPSVGSGGVGVYVVVVQPGSVVLVEWEVAGTGDDGSSGGAGLGGTEGSGASNGGVSVMRGVSAVAGVAMVIMGSALLLL